MEGLLLWGEGKELSWGQKLSFQLWLCHIDSLLLSLSFPTCKWGVITSMPISVLLWGSMNTNDSGCVWGKPGHLYTWKGRLFPWGACGFHRGPWSYGMTGIGKRPNNGHFIVELSLHLPALFKGNVLPSPPLPIFMGGMGARCQTVWVWKSSLGRPGQELMHSPRWE